MIDFTETCKTATKELTWLIDRAKLKKEYDECLEKSFTGKMPYPMFIKLMRNNKWGRVSENGKYEWNVQSMNAGLSYNTKTGIIQFTYYVAKQH